MRESGLLWELGEYTYVKHAVRLRRRTHIPEGTSREPALIIISAIQLPRPGANDETGHRYRVLKKKRREKKERKRNRFTFH
jgi:hypothetical protein